MATIRWLVRIDTRPRLHVRTKFLFESDQVYGGMDLAMFLGFEVTDSVYVFDLDVAEATEPEPVVTSMHIERVNETIDSAFNPSGTFGGFSYTRLLSTSQMATFSVQVKAV